MTRKKQPPLYRYVIVVDTLDNRWVHDSTSRTRDALLESLEAGAQGMWLARRNSHGEQEFYAYVQWTCDMRVLTWDEHTASKSRAPVQGLEPWCDALPQAPGLPDERTLRSSQPPHGDPGENITPPNDHQRKVEALAIAQRDEDTASVGKRPPRSVALITALASMGTSGATVHELTRIVHGVVDSLNTARCKGQLDYLERAGKVLRGSEGRWWLTKLGCATHIKRLATKDKQVAA